MTKPELKCILSFSYTYKNNFKKYVFVFILMFDLVCLTNEKVNIECEI